MKQIAAGVAVLALVGVSVAVWQGTTDEAPADEEFQFEEYKSAESVPTVKPESETSESASQGGQKRRAESAGSEGRAESDQGNSKRAETEIQVLEERTDDGDDSTGAPRAQKNETRDNGYKEGGSKENAASKPSSRPVLNPSIARDLGQIQLQQQQAVPKSLRNLDEAAMEIDPNTLPKQPPSNSQTSGN